MIHNYPTLSIYLDTSYDIEYLLKKMNKKRRPINRSYVPAIM